MIFRTIGKLLRGRATPFQLFAACVLGAMLGFMPGFSQAPGLIVALTLLLIILNANLALGALCLGVAKLLSLAIMPVSFAVGRGLLDGPLGGLFQWLINAPVFALFGFDYYVVTGGLLLGLVLGAVLGIIVVQILTSYRRKMSKLEKDSERFQKWTSKKWVKGLTFLLVGGGKGKVSYDDLLAKKIGNPIRPLGVVFAVLVVVLLVLVQMFASGPIVTAALQRGLEQANGATVDMGSADLDLKAQRLTIEGLALADPNALETDLFRAAKLEADVSATDLLRKRLRLDRVVVTEAAHGAKRQHPGKLIGPPPQPTPAPKEPNTKTIDDYLKDAKAWKERLAQVREWLEKLSGPKEDVPPAPGEQVETLEERLRRQVQELGYPNVAASHLIAGRPTFTITELIADAVRVAELPGETLSITATNLSTHPNLLGQGPRVKVTSSGGTLDFEVVMGGFDAATNDNTFAFSYRGLPTERIAGSLIVEGTKPIQGGTIDLAAAGTLDTRNGMRVDLPLQTTLNNVIFSLGGQSTQVQQLMLPIGLTGPLDNPRIKVDAKELANKLVKAGLTTAVDAAKDAAKEKAGELLKQEVGDKVGEEGKNLLKGLFDRSKKK